MKTHLLFKQEHGALLRASFVFLFLLPAMTLKAQTPRDFSGKWEFDKITSQPDAVEPNYDGTVILEITQSTTTISYAEIYIHPGREDWKTSTESYNLDGKEQITKTDTGTSKRSAKWSKDKKALTIVNADIETTEGVSQEFIVADSYALSGDGLTLTIDRSRKNPVTGETKARKVYHKK